MGRCTVTLFWLNDEKFGGQPPNTTTIIEGGVRKFLLRGCRTFRQEGCVPSMYLFFVSQLWELSMFSTIDGLWATQTPPNAENDSFLFAKCPGRLDLDRQTTFLSGSRVALYSLKRSNRHRIQTLLIIGLQVAVDEKSKGASTRR